MRSFRIWAIDDDRPKDRKRQRGRADRLFGGKFRAAILVGRPRFVLFAHDLRRGRAYLGPCRRDLDEAFNPSGFGRVSQLLRGNPVDLIEFGICVLRDIAVRRASQMNDDIHALQNWCPANGIFQVRRADPLRKRPPRAPARPRRGVRMKLMLTGATGQVGAELRRCLRPRALLDQIVSPDSNTNCRNETSTVQSVFDIGPACLRLGCIFFSLTGGAGGASGE